MSRLTTSAIHGNAASQAEQRRNGRDPSNCPIRMSALGSSISVKTEVIHRGWTADLPDSFGNVDPQAQYHRSPPLAVALEPDPTDDRPRHPALRPGKPIAWLHYALLQPVIDMCLQSIHDDPSGTVHEPEFPLIK